MLDLGASKLWPYVSLVLEIVLERRVLPVDSQDVSHAVGLEALLVLRRLLQIERFRSSTRDASREAATKR